MKSALSAGWSHEVGIWLGIALLALVYGRGLWTVWSRAGAGHGIRKREAAWFAAAVLALVIALASPLEHLAGELLSAHMIQHLLLIIVAAPLLVLGRPALAFAWALPARSRRAAGRWWHRSGRLRAGWRWLSRPVVAWSLHILTLWAWHLPGPYQAALVNESVHAAEHLTFLATAYLFWQALVWLGGKKRLGYGAGVLYLFTAALAETPLGALMLFSTQIWYPAYAATAPAFGRSALDDQQLAGTIMWIPPMLVMLGAAAGLFLAWLDALEKRMQARETGRAKNDRNWNAGPAAGPAAAPDEDLSTVRQALR